MDESLKQLAGIVIAVLVIVALIAIANGLFGKDGKVEEKINDELDKVTSTSYVMPAAPSQDAAMGEFIFV